MLWRRRSRLRALPARSAPLLAGALLACAVAALAWSRLAGERSLLLPSLAAGLLAFAAVGRGRAGLRAVLFPAFVLLLAFPIPAPLRDELVWRLQVTSARGATWLLESAGAEVALHGVQIHRDDFAFTVIETCAGLRGIEILTLLALAIRELCAGSGARSWIVVAVAPALGFALNALRIAAVVALTQGGPGGAPESWDHTPQGMVVLLAGTALLYALGRFTAGPPRAASSAEARASEDPARGGAAPRRSSASPAPLAAAGLALLSLLLAPLGRPEPSPVVELPVRHAGWSGEDLPLDRVFVGQFQSGQVLHRRYQRASGGGPPRSVEVLVGYEVTENPASRLLSPKLRVLDHDWTLEETRPVRLWLLGRDAEAVIASRDSELVLGYLWRLRDEGLWRETWRATLALDVGPLRRERRRVVVRLATPLAHTGPAARDHAKRTLDRFIADFLVELAAL